MGDCLGIPGAVGSLPSLSFSPRPHVPTLGLPHPNPSWGWVARAPTPAADLGCLRTAREPLCIWLPGNQRTVPRVSVWGSLGVPQAIPGGLHQLQPQPQPQPLAPGTKTYPRFWRSPDLNESGEGLQGPSPSPPNSPIPPPPHPRRDMWLLLAGSAHLEDFPPAKSGGQSYRWDQREWLSLTA